MSIVWMADGLRAQPPAPGEQAWTASMRWVLPARTHSPVHGPHDAFDWQAVQLPSRWVEPNTSGAHEVQLRLDFELTQPPDQLWAIWFERLPPDHEVRLNGTALQGGPVGERDSRRFTVLPHWVRLPPALLRAGHNELVVRWNGRRAVGGVSAPHLGPAAVLKPGFDARQLWCVWLPQVLNVVAAGLAVFFTLIWALRRSERVLGFFGALWGLVSLRNLAYFSQGQPVALPPGASDWLFFVAQLLAVYWLMGLGSAMSGQALRGWRRPHGLLALAGLGLVAASLDRMPELRRWVYPLLVFLMCHGMWWVWCGARQAGLWRRAALATGCGAVLACAVHDYLLISERLAVGAVYWVPYATPVVLFGVALVLLQRFVDALGEAERQGSLLEQRVAQRTQDLQAAIAARSRFVAAASHDLRQPVASIGLLSGLLREQRHDATSQKLLDRLQRSVLALEGLLKGLLDLSRFDAGAVVHKPQAVALAPLLAAIASHEAEAGLQRGLRLRLRVGAAVVRADPVLLEQVLRNLVGNALRYTSHGGVLVSARPRGHVVLLQVWDTGCGIAPEQQEAVFEEFVQLDNPAREQARGLGLGLSLVRRATTLMQVPLRLRSVPGRGSCFSLWLPAAELPGQLAAGAGRVGGFPGEPVTGPLANRSVWVVDDDPGMREALLLRLQAWGLVCQSFGSVADVRAALAATHHPTVLGAEAPWLITDQRLPDGTARDVVLAMQARWPLVQALVITGDTSPEDLARLASLGWPVLHKPFAAEDLWQQLLARDAAWSPRS